MYRFSSMDQCVYVIPSWIANTLKRHQMSLSDILVFNKIKSVLSMNDLISIETAQSYFKEVVGIKYMSQSILYEWICTANDVDKVYINTQIQPLSKDKFQRDSVHTLLFTETDNLSGQTPFEVVPLADLAIGVVISPGAFASTTAKDHHLSVLRAILKQLYVYEKRTPVISSEIYHRYLELLSQT